jgi:hypothetical protein
VRARILLGCLAVAALAVAGCSGSVRDGTGQVTASASVDAFSIKVGDCTGDLGQSQVSAAVLLPCGQAHYWEAYASSRIAGDTYPGVTQVTETADKACSDSFKAFVGVSSDKSDYTYTYFYPTEQTWTTADDREVLCFVGLEDGGVTGTLKGVKK